MKKILSLSLLALSLSACSNQLPLPVSRASLQAQSASEPRILETFKGYLNHSQYDNSGKAEMLMTARSLLGKIYDNRNSASRYYLYYTAQSSFLAEAIGTIRLGTDNVLYLEEKDFSNGPVYSYYRLGTYQLPANSPDGTPVVFTLDPDTSLKMKWRGINPMDHDELHIKIPNKVKPVQRPPGGLL